MAWPRYRTELWHVGILQAPIADVLARAVSPNAAPAIPITWLPEQPDFCFIADPFGLWRDGRLYIFCEAYDYRSKSGAIRVYTYGADLQLLDQGETLRADHHLSYPTLIEDGGETYMLPEAHRSGKLTLYRARKFPGAWEEVCDISPLPVVDPSVVFWEGRWWMFHALAGPDGREMRELHIAVADRITGPWRPHGANPVRCALDSARPGGTPFVVGGKLHLPVQNCDGGYGRSLTFLAIDTLTEERFAARPVGALEPATLKTAGEGLHTLSACGPVTLFDVKRIDPSPKRALINIERRLRRLFRRGS